MTYLKLACVLLTVIHCHNVFAVMYIMIISPIQDSCMIWGLSWWHENEHIDPDSPIVDCWTRSLMWSIVRLRLKISSSLINCSILSKQLWVTHFVKLMTMTVTSTTLYPISITVLYAMYLFFLSSIQTGHFHIVWHTSCFFLFFLTIHSEWVRGLAGLSFLYKVGLWQNTFDINLCRSLFLRFGW